MHLAGEGLQERKRCRVKSSNNHIKRNVKVLRRRRRRGRERKERELWNENPVNRRLSRWRGKKGRVNAALNIVLRGYNASLRGGLGDCVTNVWRGWKWIPVMGFCPDPLSYGNPTLFFFCGQQFFSLFTVIFGHPGIGNDNEYLISVPYFQTVTFQTWGWGLGNIIKWFDARCRL